MSACTSNSAGIVSTRVKNPTEQEGMWIKCKAMSDEIRYGVYVHPQTKSVTAAYLPNRLPDVWFYSTVVWSVGSGMMIYENGQSGPSDSINLGGPYAVNTQRKLAFGIQYIDEIREHGIAYVDGVRIFNRPLNLIEVQVLYQSYGNTETTTDLVTTTEQLYNNHIDIASNMTELNMETNGYAGNAQLTSVSELKKVRG